MNDGDAALVQLGADVDPFDVIIVDQKMSHLSGLELVGEIRKRGIRGKIIVVSSHLPSEIREAYERLNVHVMFPKPYDIDMLRSAVEGGDKISVWPRLSL